MPKYEWTLDTEGENDQLIDIPEGAVIVAIDGEPVRGKCEGCGAWILEKERYFTWADDVITCAKCGGPETG